MTRARVAILVGGAVGLGFACSFPDVTYDDRGDAGTSGSSGTSSGGSLTDAIDEALLVRFDASGKTDPDACASGCDCDNDRYFSDAACGAVDAGADAVAKEAGDCDDFDRDRHPGYDPLTRIESKPEGHLGDWNCDGRVDKLYPQITSCVQGLFCDGTIGFRADVACGDVATPVNCVKGGPLGLDCVVTDLPGDKPQKTQACL